MILSVLSANANPRLLLERGSRLFSAVLTDEHAVNFHFHLIHLYLPLGRFTFIKKA